MNRRTLPLASALLLSAACSFAACAGEPELSSGVVSENMDTSVHPGDDFNSYVNGGWIASNEIPADEAGYGNWQILREQSQEHVRAIIEESQSGEFPPGSDQQKVGDLYASFTDLETRSANGITAIQPWLDRIQAIGSRADLPDYFADATRVGLPTPIGFGQLPDLDDPTRYMFGLGQAGLGLPDREYYLEEGEGADAIRAAYRAHVARLFDLAGLPGGDAAADVVMDIETRIAAVHWPKEATRDVAAMNNRYAVGDLAALMPSLDLNRFLDRAGVLGAEEVLVMQPDYLEALDGLLGGTGLDDLKTYLSWSVLNSTASTLTPEFETADFEFFGRTLAGVEEQKPLWRRGVGLVDAHLGEVVGRIYVERHFPPEAKARMEGLVANLIGAYEASIQELEWMGPETREQALDKLSKFTPKIGYPDVWKDYSALVIDPEDLAGNILRSAESEWARALARQNDPVDRTEWGMTPQTVNAYYSPLLNEIVFPAAILQPPFFDMSAEDAVNYGGIGAVIGHEIGHGFDDMGSSFDGDGVVRDWWTAEDREQFEARTGALVAQYSEFRPFDDLAVNGEFTLGENIGDLGGMSIALKAYQMSLEGMEPPVLDGFTGPQRVFIGWAQVWNGKLRDEALRLQIQTDPHAPAMYRVNGVVRNVPEFYEAFGVTEEHALFVPAAARVKIW